MVSKRYSAAVFRLLVVIFSLLSFIQVAHGEVEHETLEFGIKFDGTLDVKYQAAEEPPPQRHIEAKQKLLETLKKEDPDVAVSNSHPRYWLLRALHGYWRHGQRYQHEITKKSNEYFSMKDEHRIVSCRFGSFVNYKPNKRVENQGDNRLRRDIRQGPRKTRNQRGNKPRHRQSRFRLLWSNAKRAGRVHCSAGIQ
jgi:hypothetical protein